MVWPKLPIFAAVSTPIQLPYKLPYDSHAISIQNHTTPMQLPYDSPSIRLLPGYLLGLPCCGDGVSVERPLQLLYQPGSAEYSRIASDPSQALSLIHI